ncbi:MAG: hypothetical protein FWG77_10665 [Treponema sp.]|nr:hypothetical protein [Treponema sp.]
MYKKNDKCHKIAGGSLTMTGRQLSGCPGARYPESGRPTEGDFAPGRSIQMSHLLRAQSEELSMRFNPFEQFSFRN